MVLTRDNFQQYVLDSNGIVFVEFFASWCPHCQAFAPEYQQISEDLSGEAAFYQVEIDQSPGLANEYGIEAIPTIKVFDEGQVVTSFVGAQPQSVFQKVINDLNQ